MTEVEPVLDFASSGRSGRRNALPDILGSPAGVNPTDLPLKLAELALTGEPAQPGAVLQGSLSCYCKHTTEEDFSLPGYNNVFLSR